MSGIHSKSLEQVINEAHSLEEASLLDKFKDLWKKTPDQPGNDDPTQAPDASNDEEGGEEAVKAIADKLNIELVKGKYPHTGEEALKDPEIIRLMTIFGKEMLKSSTSGGTNIESLKKMMMDDPTSTINMMLYHISVKARPFQRTGLDPKAPISLFSGIDDDKKDNFGARLKQSLKSRKRQGVRDGDIEKVVALILKDLEDQLKANGFVVQEKVSRKKRKERRAKMSRAVAVKRPAVEKLSAGEFVAQNAEGERKKFHQQQFGTGADAQQKARAAAKAWSKGTENKRPRTLDGKTTPQKGTIEVGKALGGKTTPQKGTIEVGKALAGKILKSKVLGNFEDPEEKKEAQKQIVKIITQLARPWFKKHIGARGQLKNIKLKEELELFEHTLSNLLFQEGLTITNLSEEGLANFVKEINRFYPYAQEYLKFNRPASLNLISDPQNAKDTFGKTAYYNPGNDQITIFVDKRHPKDMLRSFAHELVHHTQNCRGEFDGDFVAGENYIETDDHLKEMEREAYDKGNMCLRTYESYLKKENPK